MSCPARDSQRPRSRNAASSAWPSGIRKSRISTRPCAAGSRPTASTTIEPLPADLLASMIVRRSASEACATTSKKRLSLSLLSSEEVKATAKACARTRSDAESCAKAGANSSGCTCIARSCCEAVAGLSSGSVDNRVASGGVMGCLTTPPGRLAVERLELIGMSCSCYDSI
jgi:hypothetical protein